MDRDEERRYESETGKSSDWKQAVSFADNVKYLYLLDDHGYDVTPHETNASRCRLLAK
jgi:hypothetical protein